MRFERLAILVPVCVALAAGCGRSDPDTVRPVQASPVPPVAPTTSVSAPAPAVAPVEPSWADRLAQCRARYEDWRRRLHREEMRREIDEQAKQVERWVRFAEELKAMDDLTKQMREERERTIKRMETDGSVPHDPSWHPWADPDWPSRRRPR